MKNIVLLFAFCLAFQTSVFSQGLGVIPQPQTINIADGEFALDEGVRIVSDEANLQNASFLQDILAPVLKLKVKKKGDKGILLRINPDLSEEIGKEGYRMSINANKILIEGGEAAGVFYGIQTLHQLLQQDLSSGASSFTLKAMEVNDYPRFPWRAFMLDESRHFKGMDQVKKLLNEMAYLKMNVFHWHLTDDQGWRIEIKKYPKLTSVGGSRNDTQIGGWNSEKRSGEVHQGYYTQEQIKEIIAYADERHITIVPEIEMPGHASAAIAAYPWLGTIGELKEVPVIFGKLPDSYNVADPKVYEFIEEVLAEVMELFPGKIIHIGGDEVKFDAWKESAEVQDFMKAQGLKSPADLQVYFTNRVSNLIDENEHRMMGWNEIMGSNVHEWQSDEDFKLKETLANSAIIHFWKGNLDLINDAVGKGYDIVNSYHVNTYLDYSYQHIPLKQAYDFDPIPKGLERKFHCKVLGSGCQMWGEWIPTVKDMDRQVFPRLAAYAEVGWTNLENKDYNLFKKSLKPILVRWQNLGIEYSQILK